MCIDGSACLLYNISGDFMTMEECFKDCCKKLSADYDCELLFRTLSRKKKSAKPDGVAARFDFYDFNIDINWYFRKSLAAVPDIMWVSCNLDGKEDIPFSVYDLLGYLNIKDFRNFTPSYISDEESVKESFILFGELFEILVPALTEATQNGVVKNRLLDAQKQYICKFCGSDAIYENTGASDIVDKITFYILSEFTAAEIREAVSGGQKYFYEGKPEKAKALLSKKKLKSEYDNALLNYINEGNAPPVNEFQNNIKKARKNKDKKERHKVFSCFALTLVLTVPVFGLLFCIYYISCAVIFKNAVFISGIDLLNVCEILPGAIPLAAFISLFILNKREAKKEKKQYSTEPAVRIFTIIFECVALFLCFTALNAPCVFYEDSFSYGKSDFINISRQEYSYSQIEKAVRVEGYMSVEDERRVFVEEPYYAFILKNGTTVDLYKTTVYHTEKIEKKLLPYLRSKGVNTKETVKTLPLSD